MSTLLLCFVFTALVFVGPCALLAAGLRAGDRPGDTTLTDVGIDGSGRGVGFTVHNPGRHSVMLGASLRRRGLRSWTEGGHYVSAPRRTSHHKLLPRRHALICVVSPGETQRMIVPFSDSSTRIAEVVVALGEADRLRVVHRAVVLPRARHWAPPEPARMSPAPPRAGTRGAHER